MSRSGPRGTLASVLEPSVVRGLPRPRYDGRSIANLGAWVHAASGARPGEGPRLAAPLARELDPLGGRPANGPIVVLLVDGFGFGALERWAAGGSTRALRWRALAAPITTVFPSTTTAALTSLSTGVPPGRHGLVGYRQYLPAFGVVADLLKMSPVGVPVRDTLIGPSWQPAMVSGAPSVFRRGVRGVALSREAFRGTGFTRLLYDGAEFVGYGTGVGLAHELATILARPRAPRVIYAYWDELDTIQHVHGPEPLLVALELERMAQLLEHVAAATPARLRRKTTIVVTGDHGQVPATIFARVRLESDPAIVAELARPLAGDRRAGFLTARPGRRAALRAAVAARLPRGSRILEMEAAVAAGLFGPPPFHPELSQRLGDLLVLVPSPAGLTYLPPGAAEPGRFLVGAHGGLEPEELVVPLVAGTLADLGATAPAGGKR